MTRPIKLGAFLPGGGQHVAAWRHPDQPADGATSFAFHRELALTAERGLFDAYFLAGGLAVAFGGGMEGGNAKVAGVEPVTLFAALAPLTRHPGFSATASTHKEPYNTAREFASLDRLSGGRGGWNVVTTTSDAARNFNLDAQLPHAARYRRAAEHVEVVRQLWDSFEDDAFVRNKASGAFFDPTKLHPAEHRGEHFRAAGPLNVPRSPQGHPVIVQADQSKDGRGLAAATADVIFTAHQRLDTAQEFHRDKGLRRRPKP